MRRGYSDVKIHMSFPLWESLSPLSSQRVPFEPQLDVISLQSNILIWKYNLKKKKNGLKSHSDVESSWSVVVTLAFVTGGKDKAVRQRDHTEITYSGGSKLTNTYPSLFRLKTDEGHKRLYTLFGTSSIVKPTV